MRWAIPKRLLKTLTEGSGTLSTKDGKQLHALKSHAKHSASDGRCQSSIGTEDESAGSKLEPQLKAGLNLNMILLNSGSACSDMKKLGV